MTQWLLTTYFQAAGDLYGSEIHRHVISSSYSVYPYTAIWYNRAGFPEDPTILISGVWDGTNRVLYSLCVIECPRVRVLFHVNEGFFCRSFSLNISCPVWPMQVNHYSWIFSSKDLEEVESQVEMK
jgi:hypothetical protein